MADPWLRPGEQEKVVALVKPKETSARQEDDAICQNFYW